MIRNSNDLPIKTTIILGTIMFLAIIGVLVGSIIGLKNTEQYPRMKITDFTYAYQTSEVQEYTHDVYLAHCTHDIYIEVPEDYSESSVVLKKTNKMIYYYVYGVEYKVSNKGWEIK